MTSIGPTPEPDRRGRRAPDCLEAEVPRARSAVEDTEAAHPESTPLNDDEHACTLPHFPSALSVMRRRVRRILAEWEMAPPSPRTCCW